MCMCVCACVRVCLCVCVCVLCLEHIHLASYLGNNTSAHKQVGRLWPLVVDTKAIAVRHGVLTLLK